MAKFSESERTFLNEMQAITTDHAGNEVLVGLTEEETQFYLDYSRAIAEGEDRDGRDRYLELHDKHEAARMQVLSAERELNHDKPNQH